MAYDAAWLALCEDPFGEPIRPRLKIRLNDGTGGAPSTLVTISDKQILDCPPVKFRREVEFGVVQGQAWQVKLANADLALLDYQLYDCYVALEAGFAAADSWETVAQGRVGAVIASTDASLVLEVHDCVMDTLNYELQRVMRFGPAWASEIISQNISETSSGYDNDASGAGISFVQITANAYFADETFQIVFSTATAFDVIYEDGSTAASGTISSDLSFGPAASPAVSCITLNYEGWDTTTGAYAAGDEFVFYTSQFRDATDRTPVAVIRDLIENVAGVEAYDAVAGSAYASPCYDTTNWDTIDGDNDTYSVTGTWARGTPVSEMIQDALKLIHGSIYASPTGQIAIWALAPSTSTGIALNGTPGAGTVTILSGTVSLDMDGVANAVTYEYLDSGGRDATYTATDAETELHATRTAVVRVGWECPGPLVEPAANKYINRFKDLHRVYEVQTTLAGAVAVIGSGVAITEATFGAGTFRVDAVENELDIMGNSARILAYIDPVVVETYAVVGTATIGGTEVIW